MDFIIIGLPIYEVARMNLPFDQKVAVVGLFATGSLYVFILAAFFVRNLLIMYLSVGIASLFQIINSQRYSPTTQELPYEMALGIAWANVELHLAVFVGNESSFITWFSQSAY